MSQDYLKVKGAKEHNLKNISLDIPKNKFVVITGLSGSGKSSLAFDTIYAEGQRRYVESLSAYARQFLGQMEKPDVESIEGLSPAIAIDQKTSSRSPRSTVGTVTEVHDYLRLLWASSDDGRGRMIVFSACHSGGSKMAGSWCSTIEGSRWFSTRNWVRSIKSDGGFRAILTGFRADRPRFSPTVITDICSIPTASCSTTPPDDFSGRIESRTRIEWIGPPFRRPRA